MKGSVWLKQMMNVTEPQRSALSLARMLDGDMPDFLMSKRMKCRSEASIDGLHYECIYYTPPNYLAIGEDSDFITWPLSIVDLQKFCTAKSDKFYIPPAKLIFLNWLQSHCKVLPQAVWPGYPVGMATAAIGDVQSAINSAMKSRGCPMTAFIRAKKAYNTAPNVSQKEYGGKGVLHFTGWYYPGGKDWILGAMPSYRLPERRGLDGGTFGKSIQGHDATGVSQGEPFGHHSDYADYSHGCDVVYSDCTVNGEAMDFAEVCNHPKLHVLVSDQGPFVPKYPNVGLSTSTPPLPAAGTPPAGFKGPEFKSNAAGVPQLVKAGFWTPEPAEVDDNSGGMGIVLLGMGLAAGLGLAIRHYANKSA